VQRFGYAFAPFELPGRGFFNRPALEWQKIDESRIQASDINFLPYEQDHDFSKTLGLRFGNVTYSTDVVKLDDAAFNLLAGIDVWFIGSSREDPHPTHVHLETVLEAIDRVNPEWVYFMFINHMFDYEELSSKLPDSDCGNV
jgi:phosphoribosyl 1,2-cyclic phosphate phosphodiesterase